jgi:hypothetical protein
MAGTAHFMKILRKWPLSRDGNGETFLALRRTSLSGGGPHFRRWISPLSIRLFRAWAGGKTKLRDLAEARALAGQMVHGNGRRYTTLKVAFDMLAIPPELHPSILNRRKEAGGPALDEFAPYAAYNLLVDLFFYLSLGAGLVSSERPSDRVDITYLYYLPFCMIFTSGDSLHRRITPLFLRNDQEFLWAPDLKTDLSRLDAHYAALSDEVKAQGVAGFAPCPPPDGDYLTTKLWDRFLPSWREPVRPASEKMKAKVGTLAKAISDSENFEKKLEQPVSSMPGKLEDLDHVVLKSPRSRAQGQVANTAVGGHRESIQCMTQ